MVERAEARRFKATSRALTDPIPSIMFLGGIRMISLLAVSLTYRGWWQREKFSMDGC
jgi:hypothetical protein